ncbi:TolC family protein [Gemmata sp. JC673]|uniref:TolC family protein n=1 Tax=Gemmata algarum TaxID=2975278 RepID=A0ABU5F694_9BACT|nr:TolC family protein [Gemmata algarum]MDY3562835.1 TolC family protein [Gemmata algarum]
MNRVLKSAATPRRYRVLTRAVSCCLFLVLPSCRIPNLRQADAGPSLPPAFNTPAVEALPVAAAIAAAGGPAVAVAGVSHPVPPQPDSSARLGVAEFYNDPVLTRLVDQGLVTNQELKILEEDVQIARAEVLSRRGAYLPLVGVRGTAGMDKHSVFTPEGAAEKQLEYRPGRHFPSLPGDFQLGLNFLMPLDIWRELRNTRDAAIQRYYAAVERRNQFVTRLIADVAETYYALMALDRRLETLDRTIDLQQRSYEIAKARFEAGRGTELAVQRFQAEVRKNQSEKLIVAQEIVEAENRVNFLVGRYPQPVERNSVGFLDLSINTLSAGVPAQLLQNRPDIRQAEHELAAAGLDIKVARAHFFPRIDITGFVGYQAFNPKYIFNPEAFVTNLAGELSAPLINKAAIRAEYRAANARQLESVYNYQRVILNAFTEVINRLAMVSNYSKSIELKKQQITALEASVDAATKLFQNARVEYIEVLIAQRDQLEAQTVLIDTKRQQLSAIVNAYQALGGGNSLSMPAVLPDQPHPRR